MATLKVDQYNRFNKVPKNSWTYTDPQTRTGEEQIKYPLSLINPENPDESLAAQASACGNCKDATCSSLGCGLGKDIGAANMALAQAGIAATKAFDLLKTLSRESAQAYTQELKEIRLSQVPDLTAMEEKLFDRLREFDAEAAKKYQKRFERSMFEAYEIFEEGGGRGDIYGLACPAQNVLCESKCQIEFAMARGITIPMHEKAIYEHAWKKGWVKPVKPLLEREESVAIIGSGSAATHLALKLRKKGYQVTIFERNDKSSELGDGKILSYKVPQEIWQREHQRLLDSDIKFELGTPIGKNGKPFAELSKSFNAIAICTGTPYAKEPTLEGNAAKKIVLSNKFLGYSQNALYRKKFLGQENIKIPPQFDVAGKDVIINGHGDTAIDCARNANARGANSVTIVSRHDEIRARDSKDGDKAAFKELVKEAGDKLKLLYHTELKEAFKAFKGYTLVGWNKKEGKTVELPAGYMISAIGNNTGTLKKIFGLKSLPVTKAGTLEVQLPALSLKSEVNGITSGFIGKTKDNTGVFGAGEVVSDSSLLVISGEAGEKLAIMIDEYLQNPDALYQKVEEQSGRPVAEIY